MLRYWPVQNKAGRIAWLAFLQISARYSCHLEDPYRLLEPLRDELAAVREQEPLAGAQPSHCVRHQDLAAIAFPAMRDARITVAPKRSPSSSMAPLGADRC